MGWPRAKGGAPRNEPCGDASWLVCWGNGALCAASLRRAISFCCAWERPRKRRGEPSASCASICQEKAKR
jgi:hypothetical protein